MPPVLAHHFEVRVFGPRAEGHVKDTLVHVDVACFAHHGGNLATSGGMEVNAEALEAFVDQTPVLGDGVVLRHGVVGGNGVVVDFL